MVLIKVKDGNRRAAAGVSFVCTSDTSRRVMGAGTVEFAKEGSSSLGLWVGLAAKLIPKRPGLGRQY